jgi:hypothetical protein
MQGTRSLRKPSTATNIWQAYILGCIPTSVRDHSRTLPLVAPEEINVLGHSPERLGRRHTISHTNKCDLWRPSDKEETNRSGGQPSENERGPAEKGRHQCIY